MTGDFFFRTEEIRPEDVLGFLVETPADRSLIDQLKGRSPIIIKGSRGVGKSFFMRAAEAELRKEFSTSRTLPVYVTFASASLIRANTPERFLLWMMAKLCDRTIRAAQDFGLTLPEGSAISAIQGVQTTAGTSKMAEIVTAYEDSWKTRDTDLASFRVPEPEVLRDAIEDLCRYANLRRIVMFIDEAAHVFIPEQQRQFFTLMRDLRSPYVAVKAAVYPGATAYGQSFQPSHDATVLNVDRSVLEPEYAASMRQIVYKQDKSQQRAIEQNGEVFDALAFAATGNPRVLLKTLSRTDHFSRRNVQEIIREYYREEIWSEHSSLAERYPGHRELIDWGRVFIEGEVIPRIYNRNRDRHSETISFLWIHRDAPQTVREALRLLCYSGILQEGDSGIRGTRSELGTRYLVNLGCLFAQDAEPISFGTNVRRHLSIKRMAEYGANHPAYRPIDSLTLQSVSSEGNQVLDSQLKRQSTLLDVTAFQKAKLQELGLTTIGEVLAADESVFTQVHYVGPIRARRMRNVAIAAVLEYLSG